MAGIRASAVTGAIATGTAAKTLLQLVAPTNQRLKVGTAYISFAGTSNSAAPIKVDLIRQTTAGTMSALTPVKLSAGAETLQATAQHTATAEPTAGDVIKSLYIHPQGGYETQYPISRDVDVPGGTRLGIRVLAAADVNAIAGMEYEE